MIPFYSTIYFSFSDATELVIDYFGAVDDWTLNF